MITWEKWIFGLANNAEPSSLASKYRGRRWLKFLDFLAAQPGSTRILDVGGTTAFWAQHANSLPTGTSVTVLNVEFDNHFDIPSVVRIVGDAREMSAFRDHEFDVCYSNSVIEHAGSDLDQHRMAREIRRVGRRYFVQTPNFYFPIEPHFLIPGLQFAPVTVRALLLSRRDLGWMRKAELSQARSVVESIKLLSVREMRRLFPGSTILRERVGPLTKAIIAVGTSS